MSDQNLDQNPQTAPHAHEMDVDIKDLPSISTRSVVIVVAVIGLLLAALFVIGFIPHRERMQEAEKVALEGRGRPIVDVVQPKRAATGGELVLPGDARAMQETSIYPRANGYLKKLYVDIGDKVKEGQLLAEIDQPEVDAQLNESRAMLEQAKANVAKSEADLELAKSTLARYEDAAKTSDGAVTAQDVDEKRSAFNQAMSALAASKANVAATEASVQRLTDLQGFAKVTAPFGGIITSRNYDVGALLSPSNTGEGRELFQMTQSDVLRVFVNVPQTYASSIKVGQPARFEVRNFPGKPFAGTVTRMSGAIDPTNRTLRVQIDIPNADYTLLAGSYGQVRLDILPAQPPLIVPTSAMVFQSDGTKVALVKDGKIQMQKVSLGRDLGIELEVTDGLSGDEHVVTNPGERLADGVEVDVARRPEKVAETAAPAPTARTASAIGR